MKKWTWTNYAVVMMLAVSLCLVNLACEKDKPDAVRDAPKKVKPREGKTEAPKSPSPAVKTAIPAATTGIPAAPVANPTDAAAKAILDRLEKAGEKYTTLRSNVDYKVVNRMTGEKELRKGWVAYQKAVKDQPDRFRVHFDTLRLEDGAPFQNIVDYIFDGSQFVTRDNYRTQTRTRWQIPEEQRRDLMKIGKGPFPVPFGQKTADVLTYLQGRTRKTQASDPPGTDYLKLTALSEKEEKDISFIRLEMWVSRKTNLPVKIRVRDENRNVKTVTFKNTKTDPKIDKKLFDVPKPAGFELIVQRLEQ